MAENLGSIRYDVEINTADTLKADAVVSKTTNNMVNDFKKVDAASKNLSTQMTKSAEGVKKGVHRNYGQAGIQVQQFVGQLQGGQSAMLALSQQSADLGIVMGAPLLGVFISLAAVLAGTLAPAIFGTVSNIEKLEKAVETTKAVMTIGASGIAEYTAEMKRLNTASESLAKIKIALAMTANAEAMKAAKKESSMLREELFGFQEYAEDAAKRLTGLSSNADGVIGIATAMQRFNAAASDEGKLKALQTTEDLLLSLRKDGVFPTKDLADYAEKFFTFSDGVRQAIANNKALSESMDDITSSSKDAENTFKSTTEALRTEIIALNQGERAALKYSLLLGGLNSNQVDAVLTLYDKKKALEDEATAAREAAEATDKYEQSVHKSTLSNMDWLDSEIAKANNKDNKEKEQGQAFAERVISRGMTEPERLAAEIEELELLRAKDLENKELYDEAIAASAEKRRDALIAANEKELQSQALFNQAQSQLLGSLGNLIGAYADNMEVEDKKSFEKKKKFQTAQALINTAMAISNALAAAPPPINFALAAASGAMGAIQVAAIQGQEYSGGREFGGPVSAGSMYRVGEKGKPEFYKDNLGNLSMIPGENGEVIPANKMGGSSGGMTVQVNNYTPYQVYVTQDQATSIAKVEIGNEAGKLQKGRGNMYNAMKSGGNYSNNAKR